MSWNEVAKISSNITELEGVYRDGFGKEVYFYFCFPCRRVCRKPDKNTNLKLSKVDDARIGKLAVEAAFDNSLQGVIWI